MITSGRDSEEGAKPNGALLLYLPSRLPAPLSHLATSAPQVLDPCLENLL